MIVRSQGTQKESAQVNIVTEPATAILHYSVDYDYLHPEDTIRNFVKDIKSMTRKYEANKDRVIEIEREIVDIEHYMEISANKPLPQGYKLYRQLAELRRERRACKNENDLLQPIYDYFHATEVLNRLSKVQGDCSKVKNAINERVFQARTKVLEEYLEADAKPEPKPKKAKASKKTKKATESDISTESKPSESESNVETLFDTITQATIPDNIAEKAQ